MLIHLYFNILKLGYSVLHRRDLKFLIGETVGSVIIVSLALIFDHIFDVISIKSGILETFLYSLFFGVLFILNSMITRIIFPKNPNEVALIKNNKHKTPIGIIDFCWISILGFTYACILFCNDLAIISSKLKGNNSIEYYQLYFDETKYLLNQTFNFIIVLGTILAACMTILWSGTIWNKRDHVSRKQYIYTTLAAIKMAFATFIIVISVLIWLCIPLFEKLTSIKDFIK